MSTECEIRRGGASDARRLADLHAEAFTGEAWSEVEFLQLMVTGGAQAWLALEGDSVCGMALIRMAADEAEILTIGVAPDRRRLGVGLAMLNAMEDALRAEGGRTLFLDVDEGNGAARALYERAGYRRRGRRPRYYRSGSAALILAKSL